jgi:hypothetical protein
MPQRPHWATISALNDENAPHMEAAISDSLLFTDSTHMAGISSIAAFRLLLPLKIRVSSRKQFYATQKIVGERIHSLANESICKASGEIIEGDTIGIDGSWDHRRN